MIGEYNEAPIINEDEVNDYKWMTLEAVKEDMQVQPEIYTEWFKIIFEKFYKHLQKATI